MEKFNWHGLIALVMVLWVLVLIYFRAMSGEPYTHRRGLPSVTIEQLDTPTGSRPWAAE